jgi:quinol monooxygenase YgiN
LLPEFATVRTVSTSGGVGDADFARSHGGYARCVIIAKEGSMYGTVARTTVKPENREELRTLFERQLSDRKIPGYVTSYVLYENDGEGAWMFAVFQDRATYDKNADDPAMDEQYREYRALMDTEPEWHDGEIVESPASA